jgi:hypothetical protein
MYSHPSPTHLVGEASRCFSFTRQIHLSAGGTCAGAVYVLPRRRRAMIDSHRVGRYPVSRWYQRHDDGVYARLLDSSLTVTASVVCVLLSKSMLHQLSSAVSLTGCLGLCDVPDSYLMRGFRVFRTQDHIGMIFTHCLVCRHCVVP